MCSISSDAGMVLLVCGLLDMYLDTERHSQLSWNLNQLPSLSVALLWQWKCGRSHIPFQSYTQHGWAEPVRLSVDINNNNIVLNAYRRKETFPNISRLTNRHKEKQTAFYFFLFFFLCHLQYCNRIILVVKVTDILACVIIGKHSRKKKVLSQNPHATPFYTLSNSAGQQPAQEIKAIVQEATECVVTITSCKVRHPKQDI